MRKSGEYRRFRRKLTKVKLSAFFSKASLLPITLFAYYKEFNTPLWDGRASNSTDDSQGCSGLYADGSPCKCFQCQHKRDDGGFLPPI